MRQQGGILRSVAAVAALVLTAGVIAACSGTEPTAVRVAAPRNASLSGFPVPRAGDGIADVEIFEVCKVYTEGTGPSVNVTWAVTGGPDVGALGSSGAITLAAGECQDLWNGDHVDDTVTVTEAVPTGYSASYGKSVIVRTGAAGSGLTLTTNTGPFAGNVATGAVGGGVDGAAIPGTTITFTNTLIPPPTGCTLTIGYWKNHQSVTTALLPVTLGSGGGKSVVVTTWTQAYSILSMSGGASNGIVKLYAQLLGAKLSIANGADGSAIAATIAAADAYLVGKNAADWTGLTKAQQAQVLAWMTTLDNYNNGLIGPIHCP